MKRLLCLLFLCASAQAFTVEPGVTLPTTINYRCDPKLKASFLARFQQWNDACGDRFTLVESDAPDLDVSYRGDVAPDLGMWTPGQIWISTSIPTGFDTETVMLHEIGHALGLGHSEDRRAIMFAQIEVGRVPTLAQDDVDGVRSIYGLERVDLTSFSISITGAGKARVFSTSGYAARWDFGDGADGSGTKTKHRFRVNGTYEISASYLGFKKTVSVRIGHTKHGKR